MTSTKKVVLIGKTNDRYVQCDCCESKALYTIQFVKYHPNSPTVSKSIKLIALCFEHLEILGNEAKRISTPLDYVELAHRREYDMRENEI